MSAHSRDMWKAPARLGDVLGPAVEAANIQAAIEQRLGKETHARSGIDRGRKSQKWFHALQLIANGFAAGAYQFLVVQFIEGLALNSGALWNSYSQSVRGMEGDVSSHGRKAPTITIKLITS